MFFFFSSRRRHTRLQGDWSSDVCSSDLLSILRRHLVPQPRGGARIGKAQGRAAGLGAARVVSHPEPRDGRGGRPRAVAVRATSRDPPERRMSAFHPHLLERRLRLTRTVVLGAWAALVLVFFRTQILDHSKYQLQSETNRLRPISLPAPRGIITDRNGKILAENLTGYTVSLLPAADEDSLRATLRRIASLVKLDNTAIERLLIRYRRTPYLPITVLPNATFDVVSALEERRLIFPGLLIQAEPKRHSPDSSVVAHLVGYVGEITETERAQRRFAAVRLGGLLGKGGLERQYDDSLRGADGVRFVEVSALGRVVREGGTASRLPPVPGRAVHTTIDLDLQRYIAKR